MNKGTISTGFLHFRPPNKASGLLLGFVLDSTDFKQFKITSASLHASGFVRAAFIGAEGRKKRRPGCAKGFKPHGAVVAVGWSKYF